MKDIIITAIGSASFTALLQWAFYRRKHKATAVGLEKNNDGSEIKNFQIIAKEWRETAQNWKDLADKNQEELINVSTEIAILSTEMTKVITKVKVLQSKLNRAYKRIGELEKHSE